MHRLTRRDLLKGSLTAGVVAATLPLLAAPSLGADISTDRGSLISAKPVTEQDADQVAAYLKDFGLDYSRVRYGVDAYQIVYGTIDEIGRSTFASGLVALPRVSPDGGDLPQVAWLHGTRVYRGEVASVSDESDDRRFAFAFASAGYAVTAPDYLGLGLGPRCHPWMDSGSAAAVSLDALQATRTLAEQQEHRLRPAVLVSGFSQGGNSALALGRLLRDEGRSGLALGALAPISGGYGWSAWLRSALAGDVDRFAATIYLGYFSVAWNRMHGLYDDPSEAFLAPYDATVETLFDNDHTIEQIVAGLPTPPQALLTPQFIEFLHYPTGALQAALAEADSLGNWRPDVPVHLYAASGDREMPIASTLHAERALKEHGADVTLVDVGDTDHFGSVMQSVPRVLAEFDG
jgi:acetyl esterase/lipase